jgi:hypothetical protein
MVLIGLTLLPIRASSQALVTYSGSAINGATGDMLNYSAQFSILSPGTAGAQLQITLINNMTTTGARGDLLSGVFFNLSGVSGTPTNGSSIDVQTGLVIPPDAGKSSLIINTDNSTVTNQNPAGAFAFGDFTGVTGSQFNYGVNATAFSGGSPAYTFSGQTAGGTGDAYSLRPNTSGALAGTTVPVIKNEVLLTLNGFGSGLVSTTQLSNVYFAAGSSTQSGGTLTSPQYVLVPATAAGTPEPGAIGMLTGLIASGAFWLRRCRRRR